MTRKTKLIQKALAGPSVLRFEELCKLARQLGFEHDRTRGSHHIYKHPGLRRPLNFQNLGRMAKPFQVRQLLDAARELGILDED